MESHPPYLSAAQCRELARSARSADRGMEAIDSYRTVGVFTIVRAVPPLWVSLYVADRENLLVDGGDAGFAILRPPVGLARRRAWQDTAKLAFLRLVDRHWDILVFALPATALLAAAAGLAWAFAGTHSVGLGLAGTGLALAAAAWVTGIMALGILSAMHRAARGRRQRLDELAADLLPTRMWSVALVHTSDVDAAQALVAQARRALQDYLLNVGRELTEGTGVRLTRFQGVPSLVVLQRCVTSLQGRASISVLFPHRPFGPDSEVHLVHSTDDHHDDVLPAPSGSFFFWYIAGLAIILAVIASPIALFEHRACAPMTCVGRPDSYLEALRWLTQRLWFTDPPGLSPGTVATVVTGWLVSAASGVGMLAGIVAVVLMFRRNAAVQNRVLADRARMALKPDIVILTAIETEFLAVRQHLHDITERRVNGTSYDVGTYVGEHSLWRVALGQIGPGGERAAFQVERACNAFSPAFLLFVGVAGGRKDVQLGDVVFAESVYDYHSAKEDGERTLPRFKTFPSSFELLQRAQAIAREGRWQGQIPPYAGEILTSPGVFIKPIASGARLIGDRGAATAELIAQSCGDALAVEMEGFGFLLGAHANRVLAAVVCGISDLLTGKDQANDERWQPIAARNAAAFAMALVGGLYRE